MNTERETVMDFVDDLSELPKVAITILNWNKYNDTKECLNSLQEIKYPNYEILIIDNNSSDGSGQWLAEEFPECRFIFNERNRGFSGGHNTGIRSALENGFDYVLLLNNDTLVEPDFLGPLVSTAENDENVGIVGGKIYKYPNKSDVWYAGGKLRSIFGSTRIQEEREGIAEVTFVTGCMMLIKSELFDDIGLLNEEYFIYFEDDDFCRRAYHNGWSMKVNRESKIYHKGGGSTDEGEVASPLKAYYITRNWILFLLDSEGSFKKATGLVYMLMSRTIVFSYWLVWGGRDVAFAGLLGVRDGLLSRKGRHPDYP